MEFFLLLSVAKHWYPACNLQTINIKNYKVNITPVQFKIFKLVIVKKAPVTFKTR